MNLGFLLENVSEGLCVAAESLPMVTSGQLTLHRDRIPNLDDVGIALVGVAKEQNAIDGFRSCFYKLASFSRDIKLVDLGDMRLVGEMNEDIDRLKEVVSVLMERNVVPLILGESHEFDLGQYFAYKDSDTPIHWVGVDATVDLQEGDSEREASHLHDILTASPNFLSDYTHIGYQRYLTNKAYLEALQGMGFDTLSIGESRNSWEDVEPHFRQADAVTWDMNALKSQDYELSPMPFGLTGEEACQLCWYAGHSDCLSSFGLYGMSKSLSIASAQIVATMAWYFIEAVATKPPYEDVRSAAHKKFFVEVDELENPLIFYKSPSDQKWWMEIGKGLDAFAIPCSHGDYKLAQQGILPDRYFKGIKRL